MIGPNGAGKTTLLRALAGLVDRRRQHHGGGRVLDRPARLVRGAPWATVFQDQLLFPHLRAARQRRVRPAQPRASPRRERGRAAREWLDRFGLGDLAGAPSARSCPAARPSGSRSPGRWPPSPALLLLDEPFAGLDVGVATALRLELGRHLAAYDGIALLVTHDAIDALTLADRVLVLDEGRGRPDRHPAEVAARPRTDHVARLVGLNVIREGGLLRSFSPRAVTVSLRRPGGLGAAPLARPGAERRAARGRRPAARGRRAGADRRRHAGGHRRARASPPGARSGSRSRRRPSRPTHASPH